MKKVPTIVLSVSYKGVKFIDATNKVTLTAHFLWTGMRNDQRSSAESALIVKVYGVKINKM